MVLETRPCKRRQPLCVCVRLATIPIRSYIWMSSGTLRGAAQCDNGGPRDAALVPRGGLALRVHQHTVSRPLCPSEGMGATCSEQCRVTHLVINEAVSFGRERRGLSTSV